jgi:tetratricopeptide (TPR) repeat protein
MGQMGAIHAKPKRAARFRFSAALAGLILTGTSLTIAQQTKFEKLATEADFAFGHGRFAEAEKAYLDAIEQAPETPEAAPRYPLILNALATIYRLEGRYAQSESLCIRAITMVETTSSKTDLVLSSMLTTLGSVDLHLGKYSKAEQCFRRAIAICKQDPGNHDRELIAEYALLGVALCSQDKCKQADQIVQQAMTICEAGLDCQNGKASARVTLAAIYAKRGRYREAEGSYRDALEILERSLGPSNAMLVPVLSDLSSLYANRKRFSEAEATGRRTLEIAAKELADSDSVAKAALSVGQALAGQGRFEAAEPYFKQSLDIHERTQGPESIQYAWALRDYARFLRKTKRTPEASAIETHANALINRAGQKVDVSDLAEH